MADNQIPYEEDLGLSQPQAEQFQSLPPQQDPVQAVAESAPENYLDPADITQYAAGLLDADEDYTTRIDKLSDFYSNNKFTDQQTAGENFAFVADKFNTIHEIDPKPTVTGDPMKLAQDLLDSRLDDTGKIKAIEDWREGAKRELYNSDDPAKLIGATKSEELIDDYADQFRRGVYGKDTNMLSDALLRGAEAAIHPITGTIDTAFGTEYDKNTRQYFMDQTNPEYDDSISGLAGSVAGNVTGVAITSLNPVTAFSYLGSMLVSQGKDVYDQAYKETGSSDAASEALYRSIPGIAIGTFADKIIGGSFGEVIKGNKGYLGAIKGLAAGAVGGGAQYIGTQEALTAATGEEKFLPQLGEFVKQTVAGGVVGLAFGGLETAKEYHAERTAQKLETLRKEVQDAQGRPTIPESRGVPDEILNQAKVSESRKVKPEAEAKEQIAVEDYDPMTSPDTVSSFAEYVKPTKREETDPINYQDAPIEADSSKEFQAEKNTAGPDADLQELTNEDIGPNTKIFSVDYANTTPLPVMYHIAKALDGVLSLGKNIGEMGGFNNGFFTTSRAAGGKGGEIRLLKTLFKDLPDVYRVMSHELGHMIDGASKVLANPKLSAMGVSKQMHKEGLPIKLVGWYQNLLTSISPDVLTTEGRDLSSKWRPSRWTPDLTDAEILNRVANGTIKANQTGYLKYRNRPTEVFADVASAILTNPELVKAEYPALWEGYQRGLKANPEAQKMHDFVEKLKSDPVFFNDWLNTGYKQGRVREAELVAGKKEEYLKGKFGVAAFKAKARKAVSETARNIFSRHGFAKEIVDRLSTEKSEGDLANITLWGSQFTRIRALIDVPVVKLLDTAKALGVDVQDWKLYERVNRILNETTRTMENIKDDEVSYSNALRTVKKKLLDAGMDDETIRAIDPNKLGQKLVDEAAKLFRPFPEDRLAYKALQQEFINNGQLLEAELLSESAFNVRRYLPNPGLLDPATAGSKDAPESQANRVLAGLSAKNPTHFKHIQNLSKQFHDVLAKATFDRLHDSGLLTDELYDHLKLNKDNYITFNVLKYFQEDPTISGAIKKQYGTIEDIGDELAATILKNHALFARAEYQKAQNSAVELARDGGYSVKEVPAEATYGYNKRGDPSAKYKSVFETRDKLQRENPENSYMVEYEQGKPTLYEIDSPKFNQLFERSVLQRNDSALGKTLTPVLDVIDGFNKFFLERELKTILSPVFALRQKEIDKAFQAYIAKSWYPRLPFMHSDPALRRITKQTKNIEAQFRKGVFTPETKLLVDTGALGYHIADSFTKGGDSASDPVDYIYRGLGVEMPHVEDISLPLKFHKGMAEFIDKVPLISTGFNIIKRAGEYVKETAEIDERKAKISAFLIGRDILGMGENRAARMAKEWAGTPDPTGGGVQSDAINKAYLFGRAHINGMNAMYSQFKMDPKGYGVQFMYHKFLPRLMLSSAVMAPLIGQLFGDEQGSIYKKMFDKIPSFMKIGSSVIPVGFTDEQNNFYFPWDISSDQIGSDWKTTGMKFPVVRELQNLDGMMEPMVKALEDLIETQQVSPGKIVAGVLQQFENQFTANFAPAISGAIHTKQLLSGENPYDTFRNKEIISKQVMESNNFLEKTYEYLAWSLAQTAPSMFSLPPARKGINETFDPLQDFGSYIGAEGTMEKLLANTAASSPQAILKGFFFKSSYGDYERSKDVDSKKKELDATVKQGMGDTTKTILNEYSKAQAIVNKYGKGWEKQVPPEEVRRIHKLNAWHAQVYIRGFHRGVDAYQSGDTESLYYGYEKTEEASKRLLAQLVR